MIKKELLASVVLSGGEEDYLDLNEEVKNVKDLKDGIALVKQYEGLLKGVNKKIINIVEKQGKLLRKFKEEDKFFDCVGLSRSNIYFKIRLHKLLRKFPVLKNSTLTPSYFKKNFKIIKKVCKANIDIFGEKKWKIFVLLSFIFFILVWIILSSLESFIHAKYYSCKIYLF